MGHLKDTTIGKEVKPQRVWLPDGFHELPLSPGAKRLFCAALLAGGRLSLAGLARSLGYSRSSASRWWEELVRAGLAHPAEAGRGAKARLLRQDGGGGFFWVPTPWVVDRRVSNTEFAVVLSLCRHADAEGRSFVSDAHIARDAGLSERTVRRSLRSLERRGLVSRWRMKGRRVLRVKSWIPAAPASSPKCCTSDRLAGEECCASGHPGHRGRSACSPSGVQSRSSRGSPRNININKGNRDIHPLQVLRAMEELGEAAEGIGGMTLRWWKGLSQERRERLALRWLREGKARSAWRFILAVRVEEAKGGGQKGCNLAHLCKFGSGGSLRSEA